MADSLAILAAGEAARSGDWERIKGPLTELGKRNVEALNWYAAPDGSYWSVQKGKEPENLTKRDYLHEALAGVSPIWRGVTSWSTKTPPATAWCRR